MAWIMPFAEQCFCFLNGQPNFMLLSLYKDDIMLWKSIRFRAGNRSSPEGTGTAPVISKTKILFAAA